MSFADFIANALTSHIERTDELHDFVLRVEGNQIAYVDVEDSQVYLLTVQEAQLTPAEPPA